MAKLCSCYILCPLIEKGLIGVSEDSTPGCVIVTLGKNMVIRYKLSDQNQVGSWSSRDRLSAPVIYDVKENRYVAVFNQSCLRVWSEGDSDLNKLKKLKVSEAVHVILPCRSPDEPVVVFKNGAVCSLSSATSGHSSSFKANLPGGFQIENCWFSVIQGVNCVVVLASKGEEKTILLLLRIDTGKVLWKSTISRGSNIKLVSKCIVEKGETTSFITLWSDGQLWTLPLKITAHEGEGIGNQIYVVTTLNTKHPVAMTQLSPNHIALYGAEPNEEGAVLAVLNLKFLLVQARQHFKLFASMPQLWVQANILLLVVGNSLTAVPFLLETEQLIALVGSLKTRPSVDKAETNEIMAIPGTVVWSKRKKKQSKVKSLDMPEPLKIIAEQGFSQALLCETALPSILQSRKMDDLLWVIKNFSDFPEVELVNLLLFCLNEPSDTFEAILEKEDSQNVSKIDFQAICDDQEESDADVWSLGRWKFLHTLLSVRFSELVLVPYMRGGLNLPQCLELIERIVRLAVNTTDLEELRVMLRWIAALLDSHHQQIVLAGKHGIGTSLSVLGNFVHQKMEYMANLRSLHPLLDQVVNNKLRKSVKPLGNSFYSVEVLSLY